MQQFIRAVSNFTDTERDLMTLTELCVSECIELLGCYNVPYNDPIYFKMATLQRILDQSLLDADGKFNRIQRLRRAGKTLSDAFPETRTPRTPVS